MKNKKKFKITEHSDGSTTYSPTSGVGFYNPFCLLKKDFNLKKDVSLVLRNAYLLLEVLKTIDQNNRVSTATIQSLGSLFGIGKTAITTFINELVNSSTLIKLSQGSYKVNEGLIIFKQDHEGYMALQNETRALQITNNYNTQNIQVVQKEGQSITEALLDYKSEKDRLIDL